MTEPGQSFLREESVYWLYVGIFTDGSISNMIFSCLSLHPSQSVHTSVIAQLMKITRPCIAKYSQCPSLYQLLHLANIQV